MPLCHSQAVWASWGMWNWPRSPENRVLSVVSKVSWRKIHSNTDAFELLIWKRSVTQVLGYFCLAHGEFWMLPGMSDSIGHLHLADESHLRAVICTSKKTPIECFQKEIIPRVNVNDLMRYNAGKKTHPFGSVFLFSKQNSYLTFEACKSALNSTKALN